MDTLKRLSEDLVEAVGKGAASTVQVEARDGYGASGYAYKPDRVLTSSHVVENEAPTVRLEDGGGVAAELAGRDPASDLAVLRLERPAASPGVESQLEPQVGQMVLALARPTEEGIQATLGVLSIVGGRYQLSPGSFVEEVMRTDAAAFPGFAGGPLVDAEGRFVGLNAFGLRFGSSLVIPARRALAIAERLDREGSLPRGYLGIRSQESELPRGISIGRKQEAGLMVVGVEKGSPAERGGLLVGDIVVALGHTPCPGARELLEALADKAGETATVEVVRAGQLAKLPVKLGQLEPAGTPRGGRRR